MTIPDVFIIESLSKEDEAAHRYEGQRLADILRLSGKNPRYFYFQSRDELPHLLELYKQSKYRFLHVSCHASDDAICTTTDKISYRDAAKLFGGYLKLRRAFFSACEVGNELFVNCLAGGNKGMHSVVAPAEKIFFDHAAAIWGAFYVSMFSHNSDAMTATDIRQRIETLCTLFPVDFFVSTYHPRFDNWHHQKYIKKPLPSTEGKRKGLQDEAEA